MQKQGRPHAAMTHYAKALQIKPDFAEARSGMELAVLQAHKLKTTEKQ